jgi:hypothetical protein
VAAAGVKQELRESFASCGSLFHRSYPREVEAQVVAAVGRFDPEAISGTAVPGEDAKTSTTGHTRYEPDDAPMGSVALLLDNLAFLSLHHS